jgi:hypothetical protein
MATEERFDKAVLEKSLALLPESFISFPVVVSKEAKFESVAEAGQTTSPVESVHFRAIIVQSA